MIHRYNINKATPLAQTPVDICQPTRSNVNIVKKIFLDLINVFPVDQASKTNHKLRHVRAEAITNTLGTFDLVTPPKLSKRPRRSVLDPGSKAHAHKKLTLKKKEEKKERRWPSISVD